MKKIWCYVRPAFLSILVFTVICGIIYPLAITGIGQLAFHDKVNGSILTKTAEDGTSTKYGSKLIGQKFTKPEYLIGRPQEVSNLSPTSEELKQQIEERVTWWREFDPNNTSEVPEELVTASASGVDPNISPEAALYQVERISKARNISKEDVKKIIEQCTTSRFVGVFGEPTVNVLMVNQELDTLSNK